MFDFLYGKKQKALTDVIKLAFPKECANDVAYLFRHLSMREYGYRDILYYREDNTVWNLSTGDVIAMPYRVYLKDSLLQVGNLTERQKIIYHCIFSRSYDGYVRERHIRALLKTDIPVWAMPYIIKICDEYVIGILQTVYEGLCGRSLEGYREICKLNLAYIRLAHSRMISYWNEFYREGCYRYQDYIGKKLYAECFGYRRTGQKYIEVKRKENTE